MKIQSAALVGLGALGTMYAAQIFDAMGKEAVNIIADAKRAERYREQGIYHNDKKYDFNYMEKAVKADLLIVAVKYQALDNIIEEIKPFVGENTIILSVLNGITSEKKLAVAFGKDKVLLCTAQGMDAAKENNKSYARQMGYLCYGSHTGEVDEKVKAVADFFDRAELKYEIAEDMPRRLWSKLMLNTGVNQACMVFETNYGGLQQAGEARDVMFAAMLEVIAVAQKSGIQLDMQDFKMWSKIIEGLTPEGIPSMRQDALARRPSEVELFSGTIKRLGKKLNVSTPANDLLYRCIKLMEASYT